ncbi:hypothetical protein F3N42_05440 [Marinihelvus fidelis]|uniref:Aryl sulfotransferase n=1 Tax=Marinihelvus fidelis TaxID=2613842 RepID=A0A5N0TCB1_9GAMM|nr:arylsulfotransferase family protein [Marinihelvus fidelis]KAA9132662.1 hypothetical protein F3N42_05440 [Marinihelvus fidelis]
MTEQHQNALVTWLLRAAVAWLVFLGAFALGVFVMAKQVWPYGPIIEIASYFKTDETTTTTITEQIQNDLGLLPHRHLADLGQPYSWSQDYPQLDGLPIRDRRQPPRVFLSPDAPRGYRVIFGTFDFDETLHGAIVLDPDGKLVNVWQLGQEDVPWEARLDRNVSPHGFDIAPDGAIVVGFDGGTQLAAYEWCGDLRWRRQGGFHHSADIGDDNELWAWGNVDTDVMWGKYMVKLDFATGEVLDQIHINDLVSANPEVGVLSIRQLDNADGSVWMKEPWHANDIDPLPRAYADAYPMFEAGDLMVSFRSLDLIAVFDPVTHKLKWWRSGFVRRQHDPDWNADGTITVFNNNMHRGLSSIVEIDPKTYQHETVMPGQPYNFYTWRRGKHQRMDDGGFLVTSTEQGRVFEVDAEGNIVFDFINVYEGEGSYLVLSEAFFLPEDFFGDDLPVCGEPAGQG